MSYGYSTDLRSRVLEYLSKGHSQTQASQVFGVCRKTIYNWRSLKERSGSVSHQRQGHRRSSKFEESALRAYVLAHPEAYLSEIASVFKGSASGVCRAFKRFKISRKKRPFSTQNVRNPNESHLLRR